VPCQNHAENYHIHFVRQVCEKWLHLPYIPVGIKYVHKTYRTNNPPCTQGTLHTNFHIVELKFTQMGAFCAPVPTVLCVHMFTHIKPNSVSKKMSILDQFHHCLQAEDNYSNQVWLWDHVAGQHALLVVL
jgi:hypothetical protein